MNETNNNWKLRIALQQLKILDYAEHLYKMMFGGRRNENR